MKTRKELNLLTAQEQEEITELIGKCIEYEGLELSAPDFSAEDAFVYRSYDPENGMLTGIIIIYDMDEMLEMTAFTHPEHRCEGVFTGLFETVADEFTDYPICIYTDGCSYDALVTLDNLGCEYECTEHLMMLEKPAEKKSAPSPVTVTPAEENELEDLAEIHSSAFETDSEVSSAFLRQAYEDSQVWAIKKGGTPVGMVITSSSSSESCIYGFAVSPEYQNRGFASAALDLLLSSGIKYPVTLNVTEENKPAFLMYRKAGFISVKELMEYWY